MLYATTLISLIEVLLVLVPTLLSVAFITVAERKTMASMQRRLGPNIVGYYGLLQAFADALKLLLKEYVSPTQANIILFFLGPVVTLIFSLLGFSVIPYGPGLTVSDFNLGILYMLAMSSLSTYGILLAGWSANSKYAFLGSLRSTAQLISYELVLSSAILLVILFSGSLSLIVNVEIQKAIWYIYPLFPVFVIFFIGSIAETNRAPFDLAEAESELVSGFMTEHAAVIFVFFFLAEYASILLICILTSILFLGGYLFDPAILYNALYYICIPYWYLILAAESVTHFLISNYVNVKYTTLNIISGASAAELYYFDRKLHLIGWNEFKLYNFFIESKSSLLTCMSYKDPAYLVTISTDAGLFSNPLVKGILSGLVLGIKSSIMIFIFIWARASFPRIRYDQLMSFCWTILLPLVIGFIVLFPCILYTFAIIPVNIYV